MTKSRRHHAQWLHRPGGVLALLLLLPCHPAVGAVDTEPSSGREIYLRLCTDCHGRDGEGVPGKYSSPLGGDRTLERLRQIIVDTMPEDDPDLCVGEEAEAVARYLHENFYAKTPMPRESAARVELVRLTNRQYAQAVADLLADRDGPAKPSRFGGLTAAYFKSANFRRENRIALESQAPRGARLSRAPGLFQVQG